MQPYTGVMRGGERSGLGSRSAAAVLTLAAHGLLLILLLVEKRTAPRVPPPERELLVIPITLLPLTRPAPPRAEDQAEDTDAVQSARASSSRPQRLRLP